MCKKSKFPLVFNIFLAFFITLVVTIFVKAGEGALTPESFIIGMIQGFCLNMTLETIIDLPAMGSCLLRLTPEAPNPDAARISANKAMAQKRRSARSTKTASNSNK